MLATHLRRRGHRTAAGHGRASDPWCPGRQIDNYLATAAALGKDVEVYRYESGHGALVVDERVKQARLELEFIARRLRLPPPA